MNFCGVPEQVETPKALPVSRQNRPPPSPLMLSITAPEFQTPRSTKGEPLGITATPSPALLNPLTHEFWNESPSGHRSAPIYCPRLESANSTDPLIHRLQCGFRVKIHDESDSKGRVVELQLSDDRSLLDVVDDTKDGEVDRDKVEEKTRDTPPLDSQVLYRIRVEDIVRVDDIGVVVAQQDDGNIDPLKCFSIVTRTTQSDIFQFDFECISTKQREAIVSALRAVSNKGEKSLRLRRRSVPSFHGNGNTQMQTVSLSLSVTPETVLSPMKRTCIYADCGSAEEGTELALNRSTMVVGSDDENYPRRKSVPLDPFSFSGVSREQSFDEQQDALEASSSMLAASFQEALDEWCSEDACLDLREMSESLEGIFYLLETQKQADAIDGERVTHVRSDSSELHVANLCVSDFLSTPASIWADLPSPVAYEETEICPTRSNRKLYNRAGVANAQARRWKQLQTEMNFGCFDRSEACVAITRSFDDVDGTEATVATSQRIASRDFTNTSGYGLFELFPPGLWGTNADSLLMEDEECYFYDSEPECSRMLTRRKGPRRIEAERQCKPTTTGTEKGPRLDFALPRHLGSRFDDEYAIAIIDIMKSEQLPLLWHPTPTKAMPNRSPRCVTAWIERGTYLLTQAFIQPKFMWRPAQEMNLDSRRLNVASEAPERVDLLEIARVQDSPNIDRSRFPFANKSRSFVIETQTEVHLFEAQTEHDKKRIVFGLKLTVSRLASLIMIRDTKAVDEFFEPAVVPGEAPEFTRNRF